jgi:hypothetical protein
MKLILMFGRLRLLEAGVVYAGWNFLPFQIIINYSTKGRSRYEVT